MNTGIANFYENYKVKCETSKNVQQKRWELIKLSFYL